MAIMDSIKGLFGKFSGGDSAPQVDRAALEAQVRASELFKLLPSENIQAMLDHMAPKKVKAGQAVITQGEEGDFYALIVEGKAKVTRTEPGRPEPQLLAELAPPAGVGEDALLSNAPRNASVVMIDDGLVMHLSRDAFNDYVKEPVLTWYSAVDALQKVKGGAVWLDVREGRELSDNLAGAVHIPLTVLRNRLAELDNAKEYICYCENGRFSSSAAFILHSKGLKAGVLRGGLRRMKQRGA